MRGVNGQTKLLYKVTRKTWALRGLFGNRRRLSSSTGSQCPKTQSSLRPIRLPKSGSKFRAFGRSQNIHTPSSNKPAVAHRRNRRNGLFQLPKAGGKSCRGAPVRTPPENGFQKQTMILCRGPPASLAFPKDLSRAQLSRGRRPGGARPSPQKGAVVILQAMEIFVFWQSVRSALVLRCAQRGSGAALCGFYVGVFPSKCGASRCHT